MPIIYTYVIKSPVLQIARSHCPLGGTDCWNGKWQWFRKIQNVEKETQHGNLKLSREEARHCKLHHYLFAVVGKGLKIVVDSAEHAVELATSFSNSLPYDQTRHQLMFRIVQCPGKHSATFQEELHSFF